jgi:nucleotide-binding universal stress UspA family protein
VVGKYLTMGAIMTTQRIIVGVDGSVGARTAVEWAVDECRRRSCTLLVVHSPDARGGYGYDPAAERLITAHAAAASARQPGVPVTTLLSHDPAAETLINLSADAELVVVGTRGDGGFVSTMLGSVSNRTAVHAHAPVAVIPERVLPPANGTAPRVVVGASGGHAGRLAVAFAQREAQVRSATLQIVVADDEPAEALLQAADGAAVLVVGCHHSEDRWSTRLGPVPSSVLHRCPCPVVVVGAVHRSSSMAAGGAGRGGHESA